MRQMISGLVAAIAVMTVGAMPAMACGGGLFGSCSPCGAYVSPCAQPVYVAPPVPVYTGCNTCGGGWAVERLPDPVQEYTPVHQYYYADQGPTYSGPGNYAPYPTYREGGYGYGYGYHHRPYGYGYHRWHNTGYGYGGYHRAWRHAGYGYGSRHYGYGGYRQHPISRYY